MSLLERMGLVRTEYDGVPNVPVQSVPAEYEADLPEIDATQVSYEDVIQSIYQQGGVADDNSIFKIKAYIDILPQEMTKIKNCLLYTSRCV